jgi:hypothetical protein
MFPLEQSVPYNSRKEVMLQTSSFSHQGNTLNVKDLKFSSKIRAFTANFK